MGKKPIEIRLLGRFEVARGGASVELPPSKKARALLAYLVATERAHPRGHLSGLLWDEREDSRAALRWALSRLRPVVDDEQASRLEADRDLVGFDPQGVEVDLATVRADLKDGVDRVSTEVLRAAAARFRGDFLEGLDLADCFGFNAWCIAEREAARALRTTILSTIVDRLTDDPEAALAYARARLDLDPLAGAAQASVVRILGALGRQREAEQLYESFKHMVKTRLGERASGELELARIAIKRVAPQPVAAVALIDEAPAAAVAPVAPAAPLASLARTPFVGRERELATLTKALDGAMAGDGRVVEIAGEAGMGKSRLVEELVHQARLRGARVLVGHCLEGDGAPAFLPFLDSLDAALSNESDLERLVGDDAALAARLFPRLAARLRAPSTPIVADATSERYLVFQAVATLLERVAAPAGALFVIEDLHWIDQPSLALLRYLAGRLETMRLLVVATYRDEDLDARQRDTLADLRRQGATLVALKGLESTNVHALVDALAGALGSEEVPKGVREKLAEATGGHPLFVHEILKSLVEENALARGALVVPESVRQVIGRRIARLSERARRLLTSVSPIIGAFRWELLRSLCDDGEDALLDALEEVLASQLLREGVGGGAATYEFSHRLVAQVLHDSLPVPRRARLNRQIAEAIERVHASDLDPHVPALAHHFFMASSDATADAAKTKAIDYAIRAADRAAALVAFEEAARHYQRAVDLIGAGDRSRVAELLRRRGRALAIVSAWTEAIEAYERALDHADPDAREWRAEVLVELGSASLWAMKMPAVQKRAKEADAIVRTLGREDLTLTVGGIFAQCLASDGQLPDAIEKYSELRALRRDRHVPSLALAPLTLYWNGRIDEAIVWAHEALALARKANDIVAMLVGLPPLGMALAASGRYREAAATFAEVRAIGDRARATSFLSRAVSMSTGFHLDVGDVDTAEDLAAEARELGRIAGWPPGIVSAGIDLVTCRLHRGDIAGAEAMLDESAKTAAAIASGAPGVSGFHDFLWSIRIAWGRAELAAARGAHDDVERHAADTLAKAGGARPKYEVAALVTRARSRSARGKDQDARADLERAIGLARTSKDPALLLRVLRPLLAIDGSDVLAGEARSLERAISQAR